MKDGLVSFLPRFGGAFFSLFNPFTSPAIRSPKSHIFRFFNRLDVTFARVIAYDYLVVLLIHWQVVNFCAITRSNIAFDHWIRLDLKTLTYFNPKCFGKKTSILRKFTGCN
jgi:hypothetical protein